MSVTRGEEFHPNDAEMDTVYPEAPLSPSVPVSPDAPGRPPYQDKVDEIMRTPLENRDRRMPGPGLREGGPTADRSQHGGTLSKNWDSGADTKGHG